MKKPARARKSDAAIRAALAPFPDKIPVFRILAMGPSFQQWVGRHSSARYRPQPGEVTIGINLAPSWAPPCVTHGIALDDLEEDKLTHPDYVREILSVTHVPFLVSTVYPWCPDNFIPYPLFPVADTLERARIVPRRIADRLWCNTGVYAIALGLFLKEQLGGRGPTVFSLYGFEFRERAHPPGDGEPAAPPWRSYHGQRRLHEPGLDECAYLLGVASGRYRIELEIADGDPFLGHDRVPLLHGYRRGLNALRFEDFHPARGRVVSDFKRGGGKRPPRGTSAARRTGNARS